MAKFTVTINEDKCKGCELCIAFCPKGVLEIDKENSNASGYFPANAKNIENCIGCLSCARMCPEIAIKIEKND